MAPTLCQAVAVRHFTGIALSGSSGLDFLPFFQPSVLNCRLPFLASLSAVLDDVPSAAGYRIRHHVCRRSSEAS